MHLIFRDGIVNVLPLLSLLSINESIPFHLHLRTHPPCKKTIISPVDISTTKRFLWYNHLLVCSASKSNLKSMATNNTFNARIEHDMK
mmetsp:Transcript_13706/g.29850  ORF Transcript_13706/g.29850 Transcript_13706/m.29850 type:complete len:88 (-) Transcript_13706:22-285(-)